MSYWGRTGVIFPDPSPLNFHFTASQMILHPCLIKKHHHHHPCGLPFLKPKQFFFFFILNKIFSQGELNRSPLLLPFRRLSPSVRSKDRNSRFLVAAFDWGAARWGEAFALLTSKEILFPLSFSCRNVSPTSPNRDRQKKKNRNVD